MSLSTSGQQSINRVTVEQIFTHAKQLIAVAKTHGHRAFLLFECHHSNDIHLIRQWFDALSEKRRLWLPQQTSADRTDEIQQLLGTESSLVIYNATDGFDPRLLAASTGTLNAGGLYLLLTPPLNTWATQFDAEYGNSHSVFLQRLALEFKQHCEPSEINHLWQIAPASQQVARTPLSGARLTEQNEILDRLKNDIRAATPQVIVIQADRGRGKSTLLARALIDQETPNNISVTALHDSATIVLKQYCRQHGHKVQTVSLQQALQGSHDCLFVDEAATIPISQLLTLASRSKQIVFATTVEGYEGAGRGFATRFAKQLDEHYPDWHLYQPAQPIRWQSGDRLEALINKTLLLKCALPQVPTNFKLNDIHCEPITPEKLIQDPTLLEHTFAILARAHYQTTALDLRHMLDSPGITVWVASINGAPCAAALVCTEGQIDTNLYSDVAHKKRRLKHQLLPQLLTQFTLSKGLLDKRYQRIVRIAVEPTIQGRGIGSTLIQAIIENSNTGQQHADAIGTSFGADTATVGFWLKQGLVPVHLGYKRNPRSGLPSVCMLLAHSSALKAAQSDAQAILRGNLQTLLQAAEITSTTPNEYAHLVDLVLSQTVKRTEYDSATNGFKLQSQLFAAQERTYLDSVAAIHQLIDQHPYPKNQEAMQLFNELSNNFMYSQNNTMRSQHRALAKAIEALLR